MSDTRGGTVAFGADTPVDAGALILPVQPSAKTLRFDGPRKLRFTGRYEEPEERFGAAQRILDQLQQCLPRRRAG